MNARLERLRRAVGKSHPRLPPRAAAWLHQMEAEIGFSLTDEEDTMPVESRIVERWFQDQVEQRLAPLFRSLADLYTRPHVPISESALAVDIRTALGCDGETIARLLPGVQGVLLDMLLPEEGSG